MIYEFEGRTEREAIEAAAAQLGLETDGFDVEILESQAGGLFKKGKARIRVHTHEMPGTKVRAAAPVKSAVSAGSVSSAAAAAYDEESSDDETEMRMPHTPRTLSAAPLLPEGEFEEKMIAWTTEAIAKMGYDAKVTVLFREEKKIGLKIDSPNASIIIGKKGKNLDALQLLANVYAGRLGREDMRIILDSENYRIRREESLVRMAYESAEQVRRTSRSVLLEPMNPFERRIVHTTLNDIVDIETKSEGEGLYKQVRVMFRGRK